jgi:hypothetical protein
MNNRRSQVGWLHTQISPGTSTLRWEQLGTLSAYSQQYTLSAYSQQYTLSAYSQQYTLSAYSQQYTLTVRTTASLQVPRLLHGPAPRRGSGQGMVAAQVTRIWYCGMEEFRLLMACTHLQQQK